MPYTLTRQTGLCFSYTPFSFVTVLHSTAVATGGYDWQKIGEEEEKGLLGRNRIMAKWREGGKR